MSIRKLAGLAAGFALAVGLIGGGVSAQFTDQVSAVQKITVATLSCGITSASAGAVSLDSDIASDGKSVTYLAPEIKSSDAGQSAFSFTVANTGSIATAVTVTTSWTGNLSNKFTDMLTLPGPYTLTLNGASHPFAGGIAWTELGTIDLTTSGWITYTVACGEV